MFRIYDIADVRNMIHSLMGESLHYTLINPITVKVWNGPFAGETVTVDTVRKNSKASRPRFVYKDKFVELSHCDEGQLKVEFRNMALVLEENTVNAQRKKLLEFIIPNIGRDLEEELATISVKLKNVKSEGEKYVRILTGTIEEINELTLSELSSLYSLIKGVNSTLNTQVWVENISDYHSLTSKDKAKYHRFKFLQSGYQSGNIHYFLRNMWDESSMYNCDYPLCQDLGYLSEQDVERITEWLLINNYKKIGINQESSSLTNNIYFLVNAGWRLTTTTVLSTEWKSDYKTLIFEHD